MNDYNLTQPLTCPVYSDYLAPQPEDDLIDNNALRLVPFMVRF